MNNSRKERILTKLAAVKTASLPRYLANMAAKGRAAPMVRKGIPGASREGVNVRNRAWYMNNQLKKAREGKDAARLMAFRKKPIKSDVMREYAVHASSNARMAGRDAKRRGQQALNLIPNRPAP